MRTEIRRERTVELFNEGFRIDDLKRWKTAENEMPQAMLGKMCIRDRIYTLNRFENKTSPEIANELNLSCRTVENHLFLGRREMREFFRNCI